MSEYIDEFKNEYVQLSKRIEIVTAQATETDGYAGELLGAQLALMKAYRNILRERAVIEHIDLPDLSD